MQIPANNGKKLVGQPSISQESKNIQLQIKIPQVTDSWDIPGTPILGKKSPQNQSGPKINISLSIQINLKNSDIDYQNENIKIKNVEVLECSTTQNNVNNNTQNSVNSNNTNKLIENILMESQTSNTSTSNCSSINNDFKIIENSIVNNPIDKINPPIIINIKENVTNTKLDYIGKSPNYATDQKISQKIEKLSSNKISVNLSQQLLCPEVQIDKVDLENSLGQKEEIDEQINISKIKSKENYPEDLDEQKIDYCKTVQSSYNTDISENNRIKEKSDFKSALCMKNGARNTKALSWLQYLEDFPSQNKFMTIMLVLLTSMVIGSTLASFGLLFFIIAYISMSNERLLLIAMTERGTNRIDMNKHETKPESKPIKSSNRLIKTLNKLINVLNYIRFYLAKKIRYKIAIIQTF